MATVRRHRFASTATCVVSGFHEAASSCHRRRQFRRCAGGCGRSGSSHTRSLARKRPCAMSRTPGGRSHPCFGEWRHPHQHRSRLDVIASGASCSGASEGGCGCTARVDAGRGAGRSLAGPRPVLRRCAPSLDRRPVPRAVAEDGALPGVMESLQEAACLDSELAFGPIATVADTQDVAPRGVAWSEAATNCACSRQRERSGLRTPVSSSSGLYAIVAQRRQGLTGQLPDLFPLLGGASACLTPPARFVCRWCSSA